MSEKLKWFLFSTILSYEDSGSFVTYHNEKNLMSMFSFSFFFPQIWSRNVYCLHIYPYSPKCMWCLIFVKPIIEFYVAQYIKN